MLPACAMLLAVAGCQSTGASDGTGYKRLTPNAGTRSYIIANDLPFARQVAAHNRQCAKDDGCQ